jgi:hypothetical protein
MSFYERNGAAIVIVPCSLQNVCGVGRPCARAQTVSQLGVQNINSVQRELAGIADSAHENPARSTSVQILTQQQQGSINSSQFGADDADYPPTDERDDWCSGYALYRDSLEINGMPIIQTSQWERDLRSYCSGQTEFRYLSWFGLKYGAERKSDYSDWRSIFNDGLGGWPTRAVRSLPASPRRRLPHLSRFSTGGCHMRCYLGVGRT